jgi:tRNA A37 methylthiotransferase MiaB
MPFSFPVYFDIYGCQMNVSDAELVMAILESSGYSRTSNPTEADVWLVVTCSIREGAENKGDNLKVNSINTHS